MIDKDVLEQFAVHGGTTWLKKSGISDMFTSEDRMVCKYLPRKKPITLGLVLRFEGISIDWLVAVTARGGFTLPGQDWKPVVRTALTKRLRANRKALSVEPFTKIVDSLLEYQAEGGKLSVRDNMLALARKVVLHPVSTTQQMMIAKLIISICHEQETQALVKSFHWLKMVLAAEEQYAIMGVQCYKKEDAAMKAAFILALVTVND